MNKRYNWKKVMVPLFAAAALCAAVRPAGRLEAAMVTIMPEEEEDAYILPDSAVRFLNKSELAGYTKAELRLARNEIYARHGRIFDSRDLKDYFESQSWYSGTIPSSKFDESMLNEYETKNVNTILEAEKTAPTEKTGTNAGKTGTGTAAGAGVTAGIGSYTGAGNAAQQNTVQQNTVQPAHTGSYSEAEILSLAKKYYRDYLGMFYLTVALDSSDSQTVSLHVYERLSDHNATTAWLSVDRSSGAATNTVTGAAVDLLKGANAAPGKYLLANSASEELTAADLSGLSKSDLRIARNEIFARRGRKFSSADLQKYFESCSWYRGTVSPDDFSESVLNYYEKKNMELIAAAEAGDVDAVQSGNKTAQKQEIPAQQISGEETGMFSGEDALDLTDAFAYWLVGNTMEFSSLNDEIRIAMSYDLLMDTFGRPGSYSRQEVEEVMRSVFGSNFRPSVRAYEEAGWRVNEDQVPLEGADWGMDEPETALQDFQNLGNEKYSAKILYRFVDGDDTEDWCVVDWKFGWDQALGDYIITDASMKLLVDEMHLMNQFPEEDDMEVVGMGFEDAGDEDLEEDMEEEEDMEAEDADVDSEGGMDMDEEEEMMTVH